MNDVYRKNWTVNQLRRISLRYPERIKAVNRTKKTYFITSQKGTQVKRVSWTCEKCGKSDLTAKEKQLDHIIEVIGPEGFIDWNTFIPRLLCDESNWQTLCLLCHEAKTAGSQNQRLFNKKTKKKKKK